MSFQRQNLWKYDSQFDNTLLLNEYSNTVLFQPLVDYEEIQPVESDSKVNFMSAFAGGNQCVNSLRLLSTEQAITKRVEANEETLYFSIYQKNERTGEKRYSMLPYHNLERKGEITDLKLQSPKGIIIIKNKLLAAVEKKCVSLYSIQGDHLVVKDFDSIGIGNRLILVDAQHVEYKDRDFLLFFGNEKDNMKPFFKCIIYEVIGSKLKYIKKVVLKAGQIYKPIIIFDRYPGKDFENEKFCLIIGGFDDYEHQSYIFGALQIHLHLLVEEWLEYTSKLTNTIHFKQKHTITAGKAVKITTDIISDECWLLFSTEYQCVSKLYIKFGQHNAEQFQIQDMQISTRKINIRDEKTGDLDPLYYSHHTLYLIKMQDEDYQADRQIPYRIYWTDKCMNSVRSRPLREFLSVFGSNKHSINNK